MPLFRRRRTERIAAAVVAELAKANMANNLPVGTSSTAVQMIPTNGTGPGTQLQSPGVPAVPLPRMIDHLPDTFGAQLGPGFPFIPAPLDEIDPATGRALPRKRQYDPAINLNLDERRTSWHLLRAVTDQCDILHRCIEIRISEIVGLDWDFTLSDHVITQIMADDNCSHAEAAKKGRTKYGGEIDKLKQFWEQPDFVGDTSFSDWITEAMWQHFPFDAIAVYPRYNLGRQVIGFEIIDAPTIKPLLDNRGARPMPPAPAFQQILWGFPRGEYQASPVSDGDLYANAGQHDQFIKDQLAYLVRNRRTNSPYGFSVVEECIPAATLWLDRQQWLRSEYSDGGLSRAYMKTDLEASQQAHGAQQLAAYEQVINDRFAGQTRARHNLKLLPKGFDPVPMPEIDEKYKADYDEFLIKQIASKVGVSPTQVGVIPRTGLSGKGQQEGEQDQAETVSKKPTEEWLIDCLNILSRRFLGSSRAVTATFTGSGNQQDELADAQADQAKVFGGLKTLNDVRAKNGDPLYDMPEADEPFIVAGNAIQFLKGQLDVAQAQNELKINPPPPPPVLHVAPPGAGGSPGDGESKPAGGAPVPAPPAGKGDDDAPAEAAKFLQFASSRVRLGKPWRDFRFASLDADLAQALNDLGREGDMVTIKAMVADVGKV